MLPPLQPSLYMYAEVKIGWCLLKEVRRLRKEREGEEERMREGEQCSIFHLPESFIYTKTRSSSAFNYASRWNEGKQANETAPSDVPSPH
ncbi:hypothetical protein E2C01_087213 [Portunus trituberculatus]|uniref:Uncharacterized protein n=1 Tax=Portunus trituberculatus TaxID=210409 RepID=A0A5B7J2R3_PORTR|nr:hypothetical protein [Portunus trituberculatus]